MAWKPAGNIDHRTQLIKDEYPGITVYQVGDTSHQSGQSDHNPDARSIVHALDAMTYSDVARGNAIVNWCLEDTTDLEYVIFNRHIWSRSHGWTQRNYSGSNPHTDHVHVSGKHNGTGYSSATGTGYDTSAENYRCAGFDVPPDPVRKYGGEMFLFTVEGDPNVWRSDAGLRRAMSGPAAGGVYTYHAYKPLQEAGVPLAAYTSEDIKAMGLSVADALTFIGGPLVSKHADKQEDAQPST